ncbi:hypothetical protein C4569_02530 [Candidatus Parcubacteria bacterium]|nr:MAG: hypothetical protein C4569_02530 [Candidatus Parcubacteria bacterium]
MDFSNNSDVAGFFGGRTNVILAIEKLVGSACIDELFQKYEHVIGNLRLENVRQMTDEDFQRVLSLIAEKEYRRALLQIRYGRFSEQEQAMIYIAGRTNIALAIETITGKDCLNDLFEAYPVVNQLRVADVKLMPEPEFLELQSRFSEVRYREALQKVRNNYYESQILDKFRKRRESMPENESAQVVGEKAQSCCGSISCREGTLSQVLRSAIPDVFTNNLDSVANVCSIFFGSSDPTIRQVVARKAEFLRFNLPQNEEWQRIKAVITGLTICKSEKPENGKGMKKMKNKITPETTLSKAMGIMRGNSFFGADTKKRLETNGINPEITVRDAIQKRNVILGALTKQGKQVFENLVMEFSGIGAGRDKNTPEPRMVAEVRRNTSDPIAQKVKAGLKTAGIDPKITVTGLKNLSPEERTKLLQGLTGRAFEVSKCLLEGTPFVKKGKKTKKSVKARVSKKGQKAKAKAGKTSLARRISEMSEECKEIGLMLDQASSALAIVEKIGIKFPGMKDLSAAAKNVLQAASKLSHAHKKISKI